ncbi:MAG: hypothetical protein MZV65_06970 [Chromatiales bacterium]|nr:hypothetical protein [Chromatiales bacterium]
MIQTLNIEGFAIFKQPLAWSAHGSLNVIIGENDTGKTHLLKLLYAVTRATEEYGKKAAGPSPLELSELLAAKLRWVFLPQHLELGRLVSRGGNYRLNVELTLAAQASIAFEFGRDTTSKILQLHSHGLPSLKGLRANHLAAQGNPVDLRCHRRHARSPGNRRLRRYLLRPGTGFPSTHHGRQLAAQRRQSHQAPG